MTAPRRSQAVRLAAWSAFLALTLRLLHGATFGHLSIPLGSLDELLAWADHTSPTVMALAVVRLVALVAAWYLAVATIVALVADVAGWRGLARVVAALSPSIVPRVAARAAGVGLAAGAALAVAPLPTRLLAAPAGASAMAAAAAESQDRAASPPPTATMAAVPAPGMTPAGGPRPGPVDRPSQATMTALPRTPSPPDRETATMTNLPGAGSAQVATMNQLAWSTATPHPPTLGSGRPDTARREAGPTGSDTTNPASDDPQPAAGRSGRPGPDGADAGTPVDAQRGTGADGPATAPPEPTRPGDSRPQPGRRDADTGGAEDQASETTRPGDDRPQPGRRDADTGGAGVDGYETGRTGGARDPSAVSRSGSGRHQVHAEPAETHETGRRGAATEAQEPAGPATGGGRTVTAGDSFWSIASEVLAETTGGTPTECAVSRYWLQLIEANRDRLADPANPDLLVPGQRLQIPAPA